MFRVALSITKRCRVRHRVAGKISVNVTADRRRLQELRLVVRCKVLAICVVGIASISHSAFSRLLVLERWWTNSFGGDICWTQMTWADDTIRNTIRILTVFWHQNASLLLYLSANAGRLWKSTDFRKILNALLFGKRNSVLSKFNTVDLL